MNRLSLTLEHLRGEIFYLYIAEDWSLEDVEGHVQRKHEVRFTRQQYRNSIKKWGFYKKLNRPIVLTIEGLQQQRARQGKKSQFYVNQRPIDGTDVQRYVQRQKIGNIRPSDTQHDPSVEIECLTPPPDLSDLEDPLDLLISKKMLYDLKDVIRRSFHTKLWKWYDNERLINSCESLDAETTKLHIMTLLGSLDLASQASFRNNTAEAEEQWQRAHDQIDYLVQGQYHDIIPNVLHKVNDLVRWGFPERASALMRHISERCHFYQPADHPVCLIFAKLQELPLEMLQGLEDTIMGIYHVLFKHFLGKHCYQTFVMKMNRARRRLDSDPTEDPDHWLPRLDKLDPYYGPLNLRSLDVLRIRMETASKRNQLEEAIIYSQELWKRAAQKQSVPWHFYYFQIKALYHGGTAHMDLGHDAAARQWMLFACYLDDQFREIDDTNQFGAERFYMNSRLETLNMPPLFT